MTEPYGILARHPVVMYGVIVMPCMPVIAGFQCAFTTVPIVVSKLSFGLQFLLGPYNFVPVITFLSCAEGESVLKTKLYLDRVHIEFY